MIPHTYEDWARREGSVRNALLEAGEITTHVHPLSSARAPVGSSRFCWTSRGSPRSRPGCARPRVGDAGRGHRAWWEAIGPTSGSCSSIGSSSRRAAVLFKAAYCVNWGYAPMRAGLGAPRASGRGLPPRRRALRRRRRTPRLSARPCSPAPTVEEYRAALDPQAAPWAVFGGLTGERLLALARDELGRDRKPEAGAYLDRILRLEKDPAILEEAKKLAETFR